MNAPRLPDCFQKTPKKVTLSENGQILAVAVDSEGNVRVNLFVLSINGYFVIMCKLNFNAHA